uniref:Uncharacterized protein LOC114334111 n=1 Tax=Diabrotica virgifera virgifera TaxID=50390 RepID=A0A6P7G4L7_DIAVI
MPNGKIGEMLINMNSIVLFVFLSGLTIFDVRALRNMQIRVPEAVKRGDSVTLVCDYDLESAALYTIKWYRDDEEFYRFVPKESPPSQAFTVSHVNVDVSSFLEFVNIMCGSFEGSPGLRYWPSGLQQLQMVDVVAHFTRDGIAGDEEGFRRSSKKERRLLINYSKKLEYNP